MNMLDIAMVGGGLNSFMGRVHREAIERTKCLRVVVGAFGSTRQSSFDCQEPFGLGVRQVYGSYRDMLRAQGKLPPEQRVKFVTVVTPNTMHYPVAMSAFEAGVPVLGEKPFTHNLDEATNLMRKHLMTGVDYRVAMVFPAYSMLVKARKLLRTGAIGILRRFVFSLQLGWMAKRLENLGSRQAIWRTDPTRNGKGGVILDAASNCQFVLEWLTGLHISEVCAAARPAVPGRLMPDDATVLVRTAEGQGGTFLLSQVATGHREGLSFEISGDKGALLWKQSEPGKLTIIPNDGPAKVMKDSTASGEGGGAEEPFGANPAYIEALTRVYKEFAEAVTGMKKRRVRASDDRILGMTLEEGVRSTAVIDAIMRSIAVPAPDQPPVPKWIPVEEPTIPTVFTTPARN